MGSRTRPRCSLCGGSRQISEDFAREYVREAKRATQREARESARRVLGISPHLHQGAVSRGRGSRQPSVVAQLRELADLLERGLITREEFEIAKSRLLND